MFRKPLYLILRGGLGNQLFMLASSYSLAQNSNRDLQIITHWFNTKQREEKFKFHTRRFELDKVFAIKAFRKKSTEVLDAFIYKFFLASLKFKILRDCGFVLDVDLKDVSQVPSRTLILDGYMQNPKIFTHRSEEICDLLNLDYETELRIHDYFNDPKFEAKRKVALHIRRGDYLLTDKGNNLLSLEYYSNCLGKFDMTISKIFVFSDDIEWCKNNFLGSNYYFVEEQDPLFSLKLMSQCDDFIVSPSTFSWWGAWLSQSIDKKVIHPLPYNEDSDEIWKELPQPGWIAEPAIFQ